MIPYLSGLLLVAWLPRLSWLPLVLLSLLPLMRLCRWRLALFILVAAALHAGLWGGWQLSHRLPDQRVRTDLRMQLQIDSLVQRQGRRQSFTVRVIDSTASAAALKRLRRLKLSLYASDPLLQPGDRLDALVRLFPPRGLSNPAAFDRERRYLSEGIDARGYIRRLYGQTRGGLSLAGLRGGLKRAIDGAFSPPVAATLNALVLGDRSGLGQPQWRLLSETGTAHLLVVSGLHVALVAGIGLLLGRLLCMPLLFWGLSPLKVRRLTLLLALTLASGYALLAGFALPVQRALIMVAVFLAGEWWLHPISGWQRWRLALVLVTLMQPLAVVEAGAWLSFGAVALLLWLARIRLPRARGVKQWWRIQLQLFVGMLPITALLFNQAGFLAPLVNAIALPLVSLLVTLLPLLLPLSLSDALPLVAGALEWSINGFWSLLTTLRQSLGLYLPLAEPSLMAIFLAVIAVAWWLQPLPLRWRWLSALLLLPLFVDSRPLPPEGHFQARVFDVGQGLAVLLETAHSRVLYDTGPGFHDGGSVFPWAIDPLLRAHNIRQLDLVVISHDDSDHSGGLPALLERHEVDTLIAGQVEPLDMPGVQSCTERPLLELDGVRLSFYQAQGVQGDNENSCVLLVEGQHCSLLLPGDLGFAGERALADQPLPRVDWLLAGHHGSATATSAPWLQRLQPEQLIFSRGRFNRFGHPADEVVERARAAGARIRDTALEGSLLLEDRPGCPASAWRTAKRRYWTAG